MSKPKYLNEGRIGRWKDGAHTRFRIPFIARGAIGESGHVKVLGCEFAWHDASSYGWEFKRSLVLWGLVAFVHSDTRGGTLQAAHPGLKINWFSVSRPVFRKASWY